MSDHINGKSIRGMSLYDAIEEGLCLQTRFDLLASVVRDLAHPANRETYKKAVELADGFLAADASQ